MNTAWFQNFMERLRRGDPGAVAAAAGAAAALILVIWLIARGTGPDLPPIPEEISQGPNAEPRLRVYFHEADRVREMDVEDYLLGVVAAEMDPSWPLEALKAQAILARTFTLQRVDEFGEVPGRGAHASTDHEEFQAYDSGRIDQRVQQAVAETRGRVIVYDGRFARTWFHAYSGGHTTTPQVGMDWDGEEVPYLRPVDDSDLDGAVPPEVKFWEARLRAEEVRSAAAEAGGADPGPVERVEVGSWSDDGRAITLRVNDQEVPAVAFRLAAGSSDFRSTMIQEIDASDGVFTFRGKGYGHGVGLSQWSARILAERGADAEAIIQRYYPGTEVVRLWE